MSNMICMWLRRLYQPSRHIISDGSTYRGSNEDIKGTGHFYIAPTRSVYVEDGGRAASPLTPPGVPCGW